MFVGRYPGIGQLVEVYVHESCGRRLTRLLSAGKRLKHVRPSQNHLRTSLSWESFYCKLNYVVEILATSRNG